MSHTIKRGDLKTLKWNLGRDLAGVTPKVVVKAPGAAAPVIERNGSIVGPAADGIVSLALLAGDWDPGKLTVTGTPNLPYYRVEIETTPGPLTHPDDAHSYERIYVLQDLA